MPSNDRQAFWNAHITTYGANNKPSYSTLGFYAVDRNAAWRKALRMSLDDCEENSSELTELTVEQVESV